MFIRPRDLADALHVVQFPRTSSLRCSTAPLLHWAETPHTTPQEKDNSRGGLRSKPGVDFKFFLVRNCPDNNEAHISKFEFILAVGCWRSSLPWRARPPPRESSLLQSCWLSCRLSCWLSAALSVCHPTCASRCGPGVSFLSAAHGGVVWVYY